MEEGRIKEQGTWESIKSLQRQLHKISFSAETGALTVQDTKTRIKDRAKAQASSDAAEDLSRKSGDMSLYSTKCGLDLLSITNKLVQATMFQPPVDFSFFS